MISLGGSAALAALALAAASAGGPTAMKAAGAARPEVTVFEDGLELVVYPQPAARRVALRIVVRAGGANDPPMKAGLAHLVEHLAFGGSHDLAGRDFLDEARAAGALVNAHTYPERITFELDSPADKFDVLGARFLGLVTSPAWQDAKMERERGIIETEVAYHSTGGLLSLLDMAVFPAPPQGGPLAGTNESRGMLGVADVVTFFERHMAPSNMTVVVTGAVTPSQGRELVERAFRIPPAGPSGRAALPAERPQLPVEQKLSAGVVVVMLGYPLDAADQELCASVASLLDLRLTLAIQLSNDRVSKVSVGCNRLRGNDFMVAFAYTSSLDSAELPETMDAALEALGSTPPSAQERGLVNGRLDRQLQRAVGDPALMADRLTELAAERAGRQTDLGRLRTVPLPSASRLAAMVKRSFARDRRVLLHISPLQN
jgi:predicted Zn-dependent peptidase